MKETQYSDELMIFDEASGRYILTEKALLNRGIDIRARYSNADTYLTDNMISSFLDDVSQKIYDYIGENVMNAKKVWCIIAHTETMRDPIQRAMLRQAMYMYINGDADISTDRNFRDLPIDGQAHRILLNAGLLYAGVISCG